MRGNKFFAKSFTDKNGIKWDSKKEYARYSKLKEDLENGVIKNLDRQVKIELLPKYKAIGHNKSERPVNYTCDFLYIVEKTLIIEDVKSSYTRKQTDYIIKRKILKLNYLSDEKYERLHKLFPDLDFEDAIFWEEK